MRTKADILQVLQKKLHSSLQEAERDYLLAKESRDSDTKSSAGDKFETGREMMQREMDKLSASIDLLKSQLNKIASIDVLKSSTSQFWDLSHHRCRALFYVDSPWKNK